MSVIYEDGYNLTSKEKRYLVSKLQFLAPNQNGCVEWPWRDDQYGYPVVKVSVRAHGIRVTVPRLLYFCANGFYLLPRITMLVICAIISTV
jgi:hypothetical protein